MRQNDGNRESALGPGPDLQSGNLPIPDFRSCFDSCNPATAIFLIFRGCCCCFSNAGAVAWNSQFLQVSSPSSRLRQLLSATPTEDELVRYFTVVRRRRCAYAHRQRAHEGNLHLGELKRCLSYDGTSCGSWWENRVRSWVWCIGLPFRNSIHKCSRHSAAAVSSHL